MDEQNEFPNLNLEDILRRQLASFAVSTEIGRVLTSATTLEALVKTLGLGFQEMLGFQRVAVFGVDLENFSLRYFGGTGIDEAKAQSLTFGLDFIAGEYADAIFRNRHIIAENIPEDDVFSSLGSKSYAAFPIVGRIRGNCWENKKCGCTSCPCYEQPGSVCWATEGAAQSTGTRFEDDRRKACTRCPQFKCLGILWLDLTDREMITGDDVTVISSIAVQAGLVIENFQMNDILLEKNQLLSDTNDALEDANRKIRKDLERAQVIQKKLLPSHFPSSLRGVAAHYAAQTEVGGDYYDCFDLSSNTLAMVVADVSGHGVGAALVMSMFKTILKQVAHTVSSPAHTLEYLNGVFFEDVNTDMFVTVFYAVFDRERRNFIYTNAGHPPILLLNQNTRECKELQSRGLFIGMFEQTNITDCEIKIPDPTRVLLYTDGILEAANEKGEQFGLERIKEILISNSDQKPEQVVALLMLELHSHIGRHPLADDITLFCCDL